MPSIKAEALSAVALKDKSSPSTSLADNRSSKTLSSSISWLEIKSKTGASLTGFTVKLKLCSAKNSPSNAVTVTSILPDQFNNGVIIIEVPEYATSTNSNIASGPTDKLKNGPSTSLIFKLKSRDVSSSIIWSSISPNVIGSFTGVTVIINVIVSLNWPSLTDTVTTISPL